MKNYLKHIDDFFREKLGRYRETPPPDVWEALDKQLDTLVPSAPKPSFRWAGHVAMVSLVAVLSIPVVKKIMGDSGSIKASATELAANTKTPDNVQAVNAASAANGTKEAANETAQNIAVPTEQMPATAANETAIKTNNEDAGTARKQVGETNAAAIEEMIAQANKGKSKGKTRGAHNKSTASHAKNSKDAAKLAAHKDKVKTGAQRGQEEKTNNYGSSINGNADAATQKEAVVASAPQPITKTEKKEVAKTKAEQKEKPEHPVKPLYSRIELGLKVGYERGVNNTAASKYVVSPYLQYNLSPKVAIMTQPAIKYAQQSTHSVGNSQNYYKIIEGGQTKQNGASTPNVVVIGGTADTISYTTRYTYSVTYDSIVKSYSAGGAYLELELPLLVKYSLSKKLSVYGGANFTYSKLTGIKENTWTKRLTASVDFSEVTQTLPVSTPTGPGINYTGNPISSYNGPAYHAATEGRLNVGYMLGFSYEVTHRWLFDALMEQSAVNHNVVGGYDVNSPLSAVYFRLSAGYKFIK